MSDNTTLNGVVFNLSEEVAGLKREVACKDYEINMLKSEFEKVKQEKEGIEFKIEKFDNGSKSLNKLLESQITDKIKKGLGYNVVPPSHPLIYNRPKNLDLSYSGLNEFKDPEFKSYGFEDSKQESNIVCDKKSDASKENSDDSLVKEQVLEDTSSFVESSLNVDKETVFHDKKIEFVKPKNHENPVKKSVRYAEMYRSQSPRGNQRNWNGQKSNQLGSDFVMHNKACFICDSFDHVQAHCKYHQRERMVYGNNYNKVNYKYTTNRTHPNAQRNMVPRAVLMKTGLKPFNTARIVNTAHPKSTGFNAKPMSHFSKLAQSTVRRPYQSKTALTNKIFTQKNNTAKAKAVNTARPKAVNPARHVKRGRDTKISQSSGPPVKVGDEVVHKELGDRMERAATTASSLEAEQDIGSGLRVHTLGSGEDNMKLMKLMAHYTKLSELIVDFLNTSHIKFALCENPTIYTSLIQQFWQTASISTLEDGEVEITTTIDGQLKTITEASLRRHLKLEDADGISSLPNFEIFEQLALMGYASDSDKLTFQKGHFSPQWRFLIHTILHCLSPKKTAWEQFSSNIATAIICLATNRTFNFSKMIFEGMVKNLDSRSKFLMYPRFIQILLNKHQRLLLPHKRTYVAPTLTQKLFSNMRRVSKGYTGVNIPLFSSMLVQGPIQQGEGSTVPVESHHIPITTPSTSQPPLSSPSRVPTPPHDSPLLGGHTPGSDEGSAISHSIERARAIIDRSLATGGASQKSAHHQVRIRPQTMQPSDSTFKPFSFDVVAVASSWHVS
ncbi:hypothetical protein Tco_0450359 [Tanacetum coccineum]